MRNCSLSFYQIVVTSLSILTSSMFRNDVVWLMDQLYAVILFSAHVDQGTISNIRTIFPVPSMDANLPIFSFPLPRTGQLPTTLCFINPWLSFQNINLTFSLMRLYWSLLDLSSRLSLFITCLISCSLRSLLLPEAFVLGLRKIFALQRKREGRH